MTDLTYWMRLLGQRHLRDRHSAPIFCTTFFAIASLLLGTCKLVPLHHVHSGIKGHAELPCSWTRGKLCLVAADSDMLTRIALWYNRQDLALLVILEADVVCGCHRETLLIMIGEETLC